MGKADSIEFSRKLTPEEKKNLEIADKELERLTGLIDDKDFIARIKSKLRDNDKIRLFEKELEQEILDCIKELELEFIGQFEIQKGPVLLCRDSRNCLVVIEIEKEADLQTYSQIQGHIAWIKEGMADGSQKTRKVRGIILANKASEELCRKAESDPLVLVVCYLLKIVFHRPRD